MSYISECTHKIEISEDDVNLKNASKFFLQNLENDYKEYIKNYDLNLKVWKEFIQKKHDKVFFTPEFYNKKSPITLINSSWGNGKTYFIENLGKNISENKEDSFFKNFVIIDLWNYFESDDISYEVCKNLFDILASSNDKFKNKWKWLKRKFINDILMPKINHKFDTDIKIQNRNYDIFKKIKFDNTIIVFDNLERIGESKWEVIKLIQKLSRIKNLVFILTMDVDKMNDDSDNFENRIEKFIDMPTFILNPNCLSLLVNLGIEKEIAKKISLMFNSHINKKSFSIRELKKIFEEHKIYEKSKKIGGLRTLIFLKNNFLESGDYFFRWLNEKEIEIINDFFSNSFNIYKSFRDKYTLLFDNGSFSCFWNDFKNLINRVYEIEKKEHNSDIKNNVENIFMNFSNDNIKKFYSSKEIKKNLKDINSFVNENNEEILKRKKSLELLKKSIEKEFKKNKKPIIKKKIDSVNTLLDELNEIQNKIGKTLPIFKDFSSKAEPILKKFSNEIFEFDDILEYINSLGLESFFKIGNYINSEEEWIKIRIRHFFYHQFKSFLQFLEEKI